MKSLAILVIAAFSLIGCAVLPSTSQTPSQWLAEDSEVIEVAGTLVHLRDSGSAGAPAILLIHGFGSSLHTWDAWTDDLKADYRTPAIDLPGFGLSPPDVTGDYTDARAHEVIFDLMRQRDLDSIDLIGHSLGGRVAWSFAAAHPDKTRRLILVAPDGYESPMFRYGEAGRVSWALRLLPYVLPKILVRWALELSYGEKPVSAATVNRYHSLLLQPGVRRAILQRTRQTILQDPDPVLQRIDQPVLLIWGVEDAIIPISTADKFQNALSHAVPVTLEGVGHIPQEEAPQRTLAAILTFLEETGTE